MADVKDEDRINMLAGTVKKAAQAKAGRAKTIEDAEEEALGGKPPAAPAPAGKSTAQSENKAEKAGLLSRMLRAIGH